MIGGIQRHALLAWKVGVRCHSFRALAVLGLLLLAAAWLSGAFSLRQPSVVALDVGISGLRLLGTFFVLYWVQEVFVKDIERRTVSVMLAYPVSRSAYVIGRWLGVLMLVTAMLGFWGLGLGILSQFSAWGYAGDVRPHVDSGFVVVLLGILLDLVAVSVFVVWLASFAQTMLLPFLGGCAFALAGRLLGPSIDYLRFSALADKHMAEHMLPLLDALRWLIPDLSRLDWRSITLYGAWPTGGELFGSVAMVLGYTLVFAIVATINYRRREFQ